MESSYNLEDFKGEQLLRVKQLEEQIESLKEEIRLIIEFHDRLDDL